MKRIFLTVLISITICVVSYSQNFDILLTSTDTLQQIKDIEKIAQSINNNIKTFQMIELFRDSLSFRDVYVKDNVLQLIKVHFIENKIEKNVDWYFQNEKLIYAESIWINIDTKKTVSHLKCYFNNLHMIAWLNEGKYVNSNSPEFKTREKQLVDYSKTMWVNAMKN